MSDSPTQSDDLLDPLIHSEILGTQIAHIETLDPRAAQFATPAMPMHPLLIESLGKFIGSPSSEAPPLYSHQAHAYDAALQGKDVVVVTGTNSGKTLCYNLPALHWSLTEPAARMLYL